MLLKSARTFLAFSSIFVLQEMMPFRKKQEGDLYEEAFRDFQDVEWVKISTWRRKFQLKPELVAHMIACQFVTHYRLGF